MYSKFVISWCVLIPNIYVQHVPHRQFQVRFRFRFRFRSRFAIQVWSTVIHIWSHFVLPIQALTAGGLPGGVTMMDEE